MAPHENVIKIQGNSLEPGDVRTKFTGCGEIHSIYASRTSCSDYDSHYFIKFNDKDSLERALRLDKDSGFRVLSISANPALINEYRSANLTVVVFPKSKKTLRSNLQNVYEIENPGRDSPKPASGRVTVLTPSTNLVCAPLEAPTSSDLKNSQNSPTVVATPTLLSTLPSTLPLSYVDSARAAESLTIPSLPLTTHIKLCLCGELFSYDVRTLPSDPREIIELLRCTGSERGNWMIVGACYRRQRNPDAAIAVLNTMLEVMACHGILEQELKPAFLLLSSCETDLVKLARADSRIAHEHQQKAQKWLQKVFGTTKSSSTTLSSIYTSSIESYHRKQEHPVRPLEPSSAAPSLPPRPPSPSQPSREMQSLRDRLKHQSDALGAVQASKRKFEDSYNLERDTRRKLQYAFDSMKRERDDAHKMERNASDQMEREIEARKRAEEDLLRERELRMELESHIAIHQRSLYHARLPLHPL